MLPFVTEITLSGLSFPPLVHRLINLFAAVLYLLCLHVYGNGISLVHQPVLPLSDHFIQFMYFYLHRLDLHVHILVTHEDCPLPVLDAYTVLCQLYIHVSYIYRIKNHCGAVCKQYFMFLLLIHFFQVNNSLGVVDSAVSALINKLKENNIYDCVNIIIVSDHGELMLKVNQ